jgi:hypothetical protein
MLTGTRYEKGHGNSSIYARVRNQASGFWNFTTQAWVLSESANTKSFLTEYPDTDPIDSLYSADVAFPDEDSVREVVDPTGLVIAVEVYTNFQSGGLTLADIEGSTVLAKESSLSQIANSVAQVIINTGSTSSDMVDMADALLGSWEIKTNQMIFYRRDGTELQRFNLTDKFGNASDHNVFKRTLV